MHYKLYVDGLPAAVIVRDPVTGHTHRDYQQGIPVGKIVVDSSDIKNIRHKYVLYNHWNIVVKTQPMEQTTAVRIVGFEVEPRSYTPSMEPARRPNWEYKVHRPLYLDELRDMEKQD
mmetsp:Transcript_870/g.1174  ORF Transcript_870/g.1174 Transcript_870/m.1174 type:complete len:117 (-) Transcript_870:1334-1684(-)